MLTEQEITRCLIAAGCIGTVKMSYDSGPYDVTRTSVNADNFARAIESAATAPLLARVAELEAQLAKISGTK
jgi:hypothetical protein